MKYPSVKHPTASYGALRERDPPHTKLWTGPLSPPNKLRDIQRRILLKTERALTITSYQITISLISKEKVFAQCEPPILVTAPVGGMLDGTDSNSQGKKVRSKMKAGDRVEVKDCPDWPMPTGYKLANLEGRIFDTIDEPEGYVLVLLDKKDTTGLDPRVPLGFRTDALEKI